MKISCDSQSTIFLAKNLAYHSKTKHIDVQYHFIIDMVESNVDESWLSLMSTLEESPVA